MKEAQNKVREWMVHFGQAAPEQPVVPSLEVRQLRAKLILEEALETIEALGILPTWVSRSYGGMRIPIHADLLKRTLEADGIAIRFDDTGEEIDLVAIADGCADLHVVTIGTEVACGLNAEKNFNEVLRSNDSKMWTDKEVSEHFGIYDEEHTKTLEKISEAPGLKAFRSIGFGRCWLVKDKAGKVIKSPSYSPADLSFVGK